MNKAELILQYLKTLIWPIIVSLIILSFHGEIGGLLGGEIEADIFGVKLKGKKVSGIEELEKREKTLQESIGDLTGKLREQQNINNALIAENKKIQEVLNEQNSKITAARLGGNVESVKPANVPQKTAERLAVESRELYSAIQARVDQTQQIVQNTGFEQAKVLEERGFNQLISDQFRDALGSFEEAYKVFPEYHNVDEITKLLRSKADDLDNPETRNRAKREVFKTILEKYSWGIPQDAERKMKEYSRRS